MVKLFEFNLHPTDTEIVMKQALRCMEKMEVFQAWVVQKHVLKGTEPDWQKGEHPTQQA